MTDPDFPQDMALLALLLAAAFVSELAWRKFLRSRQPQRPGDARQLAADLTGCGVVWVFGMVLFCGVGALMLVVWSR